MQSMKYSLKYLHLKKAKIIGLMEINRENKKGYSLLLKFESATDEATEARVLYVVNFIGSMCSW
jgi:hypothetical protein